MRPSIAAPRCGNFPVTCICRIRHTSATEPPRLPSSLSDVKYEGTHSQGCTFQARMVRRDGCEEDGMDVAHCGCGPAWRCVRASSRYPPHTDRRGMEAYCGTTTTTRSPASTRAWPTRERRHARQVLARTFWVQRPTRTITSPTRFCPALNIAYPNFQPLAGSPAYKGNAPHGLTVSVSGNDPWFDKTCFTGAVGPNAGDDWTLG